MLKNPLQTLIDEMESSIALLIARHLERERLLNESTSILQDTLDNVHIAYSKNYALTHPANSVVNKMLDIRNLQYKLADNDFSKMQPFSVNAFKNGEYYQRLVSSIDETYALTEEQKAICKEQLNNMINSGTPVYDKEATNWINEVGENGGLVHVQPYTKEQFDFLNSHIVDKTLSGEQFRTTIQNFVNLMPSQLDKQLYTANLDYFMSEDFLQTCSNVMETNEHVINYLFDKATPEQKELIEQDRQSSITDEAGRNISPSSKPTSEAGKLSGIAFYKAIDAEENQVIDKSIKDVYGMISGAIGLNRGKLIKRTVSCGEKVRSADKVMSAEGTKTDFETKNQTQTEIKFGLDAKIRDKAMADAANAASQEILSNYKIERKIDEATIVALDNIYPITNTVLKNTQLIEQDVEKQLEDINKKINAKEGSKEYKELKDNPELKSQLAHKMYDLTIAKENLKHLLNGQGRMNEMYEVQKNSSSHMVEHEAANREHIAITKNVNQEYISSQKQILSSLDITEERFKELNSKFDMLNNGLTKSNIMLADFSNPAVEQQVEEIVSKMKSSDIKAIKNDIQTLPKEFNPEERIAKFQNIERAAVIKGYVNRTTEALELSYKEETQKAFKKVNDSFKEALGKTGLKNPTNTMKEDASIQKKEITENLKSEYAKVKNQLNSLYEEGLNYDNIPCVDIKNPTMLNEAADIVKIMSAEQQSELAQQIASLPECMHPQEVFDALSEASGVEITLELANVQISQDLERGIEEEIDTFVETTTTTA